MTTNHIPELTTPPVLIVLMEDEIIHTDEHPQCDDPTCPCWNVPYDKFVEGSYYRYQEFMRRNSWLSEHL